jgi:hypothetical protein
MPGLEDMGLPVRQKRDEIDRERTAASEIVWRLVFLEPGGRWVVERYWKTFDPTAGMSTAFGKERHSIEAFEASAAGKRLSCQLGAALDMAARDNR